MEEEKELRDSHGDESNPVSSDNTSSEDSVILQQAELPLEQSVTETTVIEPSQAMEESVVNPITEEQIPVEAVIEIPAVSETPTDGDAMTEAEVISVEESAVTPEVETSEQAEITPAAETVDADTEVSFQPAVAAATVAVTTKKNRLNTVIAIIIALALILVVVFLTSNKTASNTSSTNSDIKVSVDGNLEQGKVSILEEVKDDIKVSLDSSDETVWTKTKVLTFFGNTQKNPNIADCGQTYPLQREIDKRYDSNILNSVLALLEPLVASEKESGYVSVIPDGTLLKSVKLDDSGVATVTFAGNLDKAAGACAVTAIKAQIKDTLLQFASVKTVVICINDNCQEDEILQP